VDAEHGDLEDLPRLDVVRHSAFLLVFADDSLVSEGYAVGRVETAHFAAAGLAELVIERAVHPHFAVVIDRRLKPHRPAAEGLAADRVRNGDLCAIPAPAVLAGAAALSERLRLEHLPRRIVELAVRLWLDLVVFRPDAGHDDVIAPLALDL